jgi:hypothetical protein
MTIPLRTGAWQPANETSLVAWFAPDSVQALVGGKIPGWNDKSKNGFNLSQATAADRPTTSAALNGLAGAAFDGAVQVLSGAAPNIVGTSYTLAIVIKSAAADSGYAFSAIDHNTFTSGFGIIQATNRQVVHAGVNTASDGVLSTAAAQLWIATYSTGALTLAINGSSVSITSPASLNAATADTTIAMGSYASAVLPAACSIWEAQIYSNVLSAVSTAELTAYLRGKYGL